MGDYKIDTQATKPLRKGVRRNCHLVSPAEGAVLREYDPWRMYWDSTKRTRSTRVLMPPYVSFLDLGQQLVELESQRESLYRELGATGEKNTGSFEALQAKTESNIVDFANTWGLLGLLPTFAASIRLNPHQVTDLIATVGPGVSPYDNVPDTEVWRGHPWDLVGYQKFGGRWELVRQRIVPAPPGSQLEAYWKPGITRLHGHSQVLQHQDLTELTDYWPALDPASLSILPTLPDSSYSEPTWEFDMVACQFFRSVLDAELVPRDMEQWESPTASVAWLSALTQSAAPSFNLSPKGVYLQEERISASLLASFALMFMWDRAAGRHALRCQECGKFFVSDDRRAAYCSRSHRLTSSSRRYRNKNVQNQ